MRDTQVYDPELGLWPRHHEFHESSGWHTFTQILPSFRFIRKLLGGIWCSVVCPSAVMYTGYYRIPLALYDLCGEKHYDLRAQKLYTYLESGSLTIWFEFHGKKAKELEARERSKAKIKSVRE
jgi:hypothetical protein